MNRALFFSVCFVGCGSPDSKTPADTDSDSDGYSASVDCDDLDGTVHPGADERCDGLDNDCNGVVDDNPIDGTTLWADTDQDGFGDPDNPSNECGAVDGFVDNSSDCDDENELINPSAIEVCDAIDNNCDGQLDEDEAIGATNWFADEDGDGFGDGPPRSFGCEGDEGRVDNNDDCDDTNPAINPDADEVCDSIDNNCDDDIDGVGATDGITYYTDNDLDGFGIESLPITACSEPDGYSTEVGDCDDADGSTHPGATEECTGQDNDCDGYLDSGCATLHTSDEGWWTTTGLDGFAVAMHGADYTGDGIEDLLLGNPSESQILLFAGPLVPGDTEPAWTVSFPGSAGGTSTSGFGFRFHGGLDLNSDGESDLVVSAPLMDSTEGIASGSVFAYYGPFSDGFDPITDSVAHTSGLTGDQIGLSPIQAGDLTGDGEIDIIVSSGAASMMEFLVWDTIGASSSSPPFKIRTAIDGSQSSAALLDWNDDGQQDIAIGSPSEDAVHIRFGPINDSSTGASSDVILMPGDGGDTDMAFGSTMCTGDLNGDGWLDLAVSADEDNTMGTSGGSVWVFSTGSETPFFTFYGDHPGDVSTHIGCADIDQDGIDDLTIGGVLAEVDELPVAGRTHLFFGPINDTAYSEHADHIFEGTEVFEGLGIASESADLDNDGVGDLILGSGNGQATIFTGADWISDFW
ncbi:MAG: MopE-related protein [Myxococcota bacterium]